MEDKTRTLCPHCAGLLPEQDALEAERDALKAKLAEIREWCEDALNSDDMSDVAQGVCQSMLAQFFPEDDSEKT